MPTVKQQSFVGALWLNGQPLNTLSALLGKAAWANRLPSLAGLAPHLASTVRNDSHLLSCQAGVTPKPMAFYFQWTTEGYQLYVRSPGKYFSRGVALDEGGFLGVLPADQRAPALLELNCLSERPFDPTDVSASQYAIKLSTEGAAITPRRRAHSGYQYLGVEHPNAQIWKLLIIERNVSAPWLSEPGEQ